MDKTPTLEQIADLVRSLATPQEKLAVELCAFAGFPIGSFLTTSHLYPFPEYIDQLRRNGLRVEPPRKVPTAVVRHFGGTERNYFSFLCAEACFYLQETFAQADLSDGRSFLLYDTDTTDSVLKRMRKRGLKRNDLERYFARSLSAAREARDTDLTEEEIWFMCGDMGGYHLIDSRYPVVENGLYDGFPWDVVERLRKQYAGIERKYFSTARFASDEPLGDITFPL